MKKPKPGAARIAEKRAAKRNRRAKAHVGIELNVNYLVAAWLATKPVNERLALLDNFSKAELLQAIRDDTASHVAMFDIISRDPGRLA